MEDNFYITLPSNVGHTFKNNTVANYTTKLASRRELHGEWEVGLVEMSYTLSWYNVPKPQIIKAIYWSDGPKIYTNKRMTLQEGRYNTIDELLKALDEIFLHMRPEVKSDKLPKLYVNNESRIVSVKHGTDFNNRKVFIDFPEDLCLMLGFNKSQMDAYHGTEMINYAQELSSITDVQARAKFVPQPIKDSKLFYKAQIPYEISAGFHSLFVYSNIVKPSYVGDSYTQLLRLVQIPTNAKFGEQVLITFPNSYYVPLLTHDFETIEIDIKDDTGENIPFEFGRSIVVLHFRKRL